jgi:hypothetical protein
LLPLTHMSNGAAPESDPTDSALYGLLLESADFGGLAGVTICCGEYLLLAEGENVHAPCFCRSEDLP